MTTYRFRWPGFLVLSIGLHVMIIFLWNHSLSVAEPPARTPITITLLATVETRVTSNPAEASLPLETKLLPAPIRKSVEPVVTKRPLLERAILQPDTPRPSPAPLTQKPVIARILSRQFNLGTPVDVPFSTTGSIDADIQELGLAELPLANSLRVPTPVQLPFEDTRIYLVDSYDAGLSGSVERFFDSVTVPFGWTTEGGLRVQCAWLMIIAGCSWGDKELFYRKAERRK